MLVVLFGYILFFLLCFGIVTALDIKVFQQLGTTITEKWTIRLVLAVVLCVPSGYFIFRPLFNWFYEEFIDTSFSPLRYKLEGGAVRLFYALLVFSLFFAIIGTAFHAIFPHINALSAYPEQAWLSLIVVLALASYAFTAIEPGAVLLWSNLTYRYRENYRRGGNTGYGRGGTSRFKTQLEQYEMPWTPGALFFGESLYSFRHSYYLGVKDDRHAIAFGDTGSGKGTGIIVPNLLLWPHNVICIDPKNSNLHITGRQPQRGQVYVIDPCKRVSGFEDKKIGWNPLKEIDPYHEDCSDLIDELREGLVIPTSDKEPVWDQYVKQFFKGVVALVLSHPDYEGRRNLVTVFELMNLPQKPFDKLVQTMTTYDGCFGLAKGGAGALSKAPGNTGGSIQASISGQFEWLSDPKIKQFLTGDNKGFSIFDVPHKHMSVYLTLTRSDLKRFNRVVRIFLQMSLYAMENPLPSRPRTRECLYLMDEFASLGRMDIIKTSSDYARSFGVKLFPILQDVQQLKELYKENWEAFIRSAAFSVFLGVDGEGTKDYIAKKLGNRRVMLKGTSRRENIETGNVQFETSSTEVRPLMEQEEIVRELDRKKGHCLVFPAGNDALFVKRCDYFKLFHPSSYDKDPHFKGDQTPALWPRLFGWRRGRYWGSNSVILKPATPFSTAEHLQQEPGDYKMILKTRKQSPQPRQDPKGLDRAGTLTPSGTTTPTPKVAAPQHVAELQRRLYGDRGKK